MMRLIEREAGATLPWLQTNKAEADVRKPRSPSDKAMPDVGADESDGESSATALPKAARILVVDDEELVLRSLRRILIASGYEAQVAASGPQGLDLARKAPPDLILLDLSMPGMDGLAVCRELRQWSSAPIIVVSARGEERFKVHALDLGADDYLTKPFGADELLARIRACLRRSAGRQKDEAPDGEHILTSEDGYLSMNVDSRTVMAGARQVRLTPKEFDLLHQLMASPDRVLTHRALLKAIWGPEYGDETDYLRVFIRQLRRKIEQDPTHPRYLLTEPGVGYLFRSR
ncbi:MAG TPA: response regulator transcription factor [Ktedonobacterales bacterium]|nr:response regulator transcription factor [Ktedonobacterales bacterium]